MSKRVADLLVQALQAASVNGSGIVRDTLSRMGDANHRCERGAPPRLRRRKSEGGQRVTEDRRPLSNHHADQAPLHDRINVAKEPR
jgi:hypothetical protein